MPLPNPRNHLGAAALDGKAYVIGGQHLFNEGTTSQQQVDVYDPVSNSWRRATDLPQGRSHISASTFAFNGRIIVIGGSVDNGTSGSAVADVLAYDPQAQTWQRLASLPARRKTPVARVDGLRIVVSTGGLAASTATTWVSTEQALLATAYAPRDVAPFSSDTSPQSFFVCDFAVPQNG